ncbi:MAG TPA: hypothetical protein VNN17_12485 [Terriglobia bacterium]|nr:hypothetical protein [Terriglobia bacterium]
MYPIIIFPICKGFLALYSDDRELRSPFETGQLAFRGATAGKAFYCVKYNLPGSSPLALTCGGRQSSITGIPLADARIAA